MQVLNDNRIAYVPLGKRNTAPELRAQLYHNPFHRYEEDFGIRIEVCCSSQIYTVVLNSLMLFVAIRHVDVLDVLKHQ